MCINPHDFLPESTIHIVCINSHVYCINSHVYCIMPTHQKWCLLFTPWCGLTTRPQAEVWVKTCIFNACYKRACILQRFMIQLLGLFVKSTQKKEKRIALGTLFHTEDYVTLFHTEDYVTLFHTEDYVARLYTTYMKSQSNTLRGSGATWRSQCK